MIEAFTQARLLALRAQARGENVPKDSLLGEVAPDEHDPPESTDEGTEKETPREDGDY